MTQPRGIVYSPGCAIPSDVRSQMDLPPAVGISILDSACTLVSTDDRRRVPYDPGIYPVARYGWFTGTSNVAACVSLQQHRSFLVRPIWPSPHRGTQRFRRGLRICNCQAMWTMAFRASAVQPFMLDGTERRCRVSLSPGFTLWGRLFMWRACWK
jgi:hypothetical protein